MCVCVCVHVHVCACLRKLQHLQKNERKMKGMLSRETKEREKEREREREREKIVSCEFFNCIHLLLSEMLSTQCLFNHLLQEMFRVYHNNNNTINLIHKSIMTRKFEPGD